MRSELPGRGGLVVGSGRTGVAVARFLAKQGLSVRLVDRSTESLARADLPDSVERCAEDEAPGLLEDVDFVIPSPGVAASHPLLQQAVGRGLPVLAEIELASRFLACPILAVTGTNGKSTTTTLLGAMLQEAGQKTFVGGNLGTPLIEACEGPPPTAAVVEVSSFQLEWIDRFHPHVAVLLNLTPDHLDRYPSLDAYGAAKARLLANLGPEDFAVLNRDDPWVWEQRLQTRAATVSFGRDPVEFGAFLEGDEAIFWGVGGARLRWDLKDLPLQGAHNRENILAALSAAAVMGVPHAAIDAALRRTRGLPHRLEFVREHAGVRYFDDSKGTNVGAVEKSAASFPAGLVLLLGGYDKGGDFSRLRPLLAGQGARVIAFGKAGPMIAEALDGLPVERSGGLADAVARAAESARPGDTVLLSPGCASFDEFSDYTERGRRFRALVEAL